MQNTPTVYHILRPKNTCLGSRTPSRLSVFPKSCLLYPGSLNKPPPLLSAGSSFSFHPFYYERAHTSVYYIMSISSSRHCNSWESQHHESKGYLLFTVHFFVLTTVLASHLQSEWRQVLLITTSVCLSVPRVCVSYCVCKDKRAY